jgi:hypothetical protein
MDSLGFAESMLYRYMPGFDQSGAGDAEFAMRLGHLRFILGREWGREEQR